MDKLKSLIKIKENEFAPAPGGTAGSITYQAPYGTPFGPDNSQDEENFTPPVDSKHIGPHSNTTKDIPAQPKDLDKEVDKIYSKKEVPTADEVKAGLDYELHNMIKPDKHKAKEIVLTNLRKDPHYYRDLHQLNIDDKTMVKTMNEGTLYQGNKFETKKVLMDLAKAKDTKYVVNSKIVDAMRQTIEARQKRRSWFSGDKSV